ncbi:MAG: VCBS repeat-containing protein [Planctomycetes bacterium]|nr:VCBS repeat-containing protein [Planctomycetota bacterium]
MGLASFALLCSSVRAQDGIPFKFNQSNPDLHSGLHLNFHNDQQQNFGELLQDAYGAGKVNGAFNDPSQIAVTNLKIQSSYFAGILDLTKYDVAEAQLNGPTGPWMTFVAPKVPPTGPNAGVVVLAMRPTRVKSWDNDINDHTSVRNDRGPELLEGEVAPWLDRGCAAVCIMDDATGGHPYEHSLQQGAMASVLVRALIPGAKVVISGSSYGAVAGYLAAVLTPQFYDGLIGAGVGFNMRQFMMEKRFLGLRERSQGRSLRAFLHELDTIYNGIELVSMICAQNGYTLDAVELVQFAANLRIPMTIVDGSDDYVVATRALAPVIESATPPWPSYVDITHVREAGHGDQRVFDLLFNNGAGSKIDSFLATVASGVAPRPCAGIVPIPPICLPTLPTPFPQIAKQQYDGFDDTLRYDRLPATPVPDPCPTLWSFAGDGTELGGQTGTAQVVNGAVFYKSLEGWITRRDWVPSSPSNSNPHLRLDPTNNIGWRTFTGPSPRAVHVTTDSNGIPDRVLVGDLRGFHVLYASSGGVDREDVTGNLSDVRAITSGSLVGWPAFGSGPYYLYTTHNTELIVEDATSGARVGNFEIGDVSKLMIRRDPADGKDYLYAALVRGHIARFGFPVVNGQTVLEADMVSEYLGFQPRDFQIVDTSAGTRIATAGFYYDLNTNVAVSPLSGKNEWQGGWLAVLGVDGRHVSTLPSPNFPFNLTIAPSPTIPGRPQQTPADVQGRLHLGALGGIVEHIEVSPNPDCVIVGTPAAGGLIAEINIVAGSMLPIAATNGQGTSFAAGSIANATNVVQFRADGGIELHPMPFAPSSGTQAVAGRAPTTAMTVDRNTDPSLGPNGRWEVTTLDSDWKMRRYRVFSETVGATTHPAGSFIDDFTWTAVQRQPKRVVRTANLFAETSFELFDQDGEVWATTTSPTGFLRFSRKFGGLALSAHKADEHNFMDLVDPDREYESSGILGQISTAPKHSIPGSTSLLSDWIQFIPPQQGITEDAAIAAVPLTSAASVPFQRHPGLSGPSHLAMVTQSGILRLYDIHKDVILPEIELGSFDHAAMEVADVNNDGTVDLVIGALFPNASGESLFVVDGLSLVTNPAAPTITTASVGRICGLKVADLNDDGRVEIIVGEQRGRLAILDSTLSGLYSADDGFLATGSSDSIAVIPADASAGIPHPVILYTHSNGVVARQIVNL